MVQALFTENFGHEFLTFTPKSDNDEIMAERLSGKKVPLNEVHQCDILILGMKPQNLNDVFKELPEVSCSLVVSLLAGTSKKKIEKAWNKDVLRLMPNLGSFKKKGVTLFSTTTESVFTKEMERILLKSGKVFKVSEDKIDVITGVSGSSPALLLKILSVMQKYLENHGIDKNTAKDIATSTFISTEALLENDFEDTQKKITSKKGVTEALMKSFPALEIEKCLENSYARAKELLEGQ